MTLPGGGGGGDLSRRQLNSRVTLTLNGAVQFSNVAHNGR